MRLRRLEDHLDQSDYIVDCYEQGLELLNLLAQQNIVAIWHGKKTHIEMELVPELQQLMVLKTNISRDGQHECSWFAYLLQLFQAGGQL